MGKAALNAPENPVGAESPHAEVDLGHEKEAEFQAIGEAPEAEDQEQRHRNQQGRPYEAFVVVQGLLGNSVGAQEVGESVKGGVDQTEVDQRPQLYQRLRHRRVQMK